jgi:hypothetical protein
MALLFTPTHKRGIYFGHSVCQSVSPSVGAIAVKRGIAKRLNFYPKYWIFEMVEVRKFDKT